jgi:hypothetical protein
MMIYAAARKGSFQFSVFGMKISRLPPETSIPGLGHLTLADFWSWAYSDLWSNRNRAVLAEFIVGASLGIIDAPRKEWDAVDLCYQGKNIEVKSAAYLQSWQQNQPSRIVFDISRKKSWYADTNTWSAEPLRAADCYVFCLYPETDPQQANILDIPSWQFFVLSRETIDREFKDQKTVSLKTLRRNSEAKNYQYLKDSIDLCLNESSSR